MKSHSAQITPEDIKLNETAPQGFCSEPRVLSHEVWQLNRQVTALCEAVRLLVDLQREMGEKLDVALTTNINRG